MSPLISRVGTSFGFGRGATASVSPILYAFVDATFGTGGQAGPNGPSYAQAVSGLTGTGVNNWKNNTAYFNTSAGILLWTVPSTATYRLELKGGSGGGNTTGNFNPADPGEGATIITDVSLVSGTVLSLVVGQTPTGTNSANGSAGGGGSWIYTGSLGGAGLIAVAGGGGGWGHGTSGSNGGNGLGGNNTSDGDSRRVGINAVINGKTGNGTGSTNGIGNGGGLATTGSFGGSAGGTGWLSSGTNRTTGSTSNGGTRWTGGSGGGTGLEGGWGGGGGSNGNGHAGGGGGGYTGGPAGNDWSGSYWGNAGGGGSYWTGTLVSATIGRDGGAFTRASAANGYIKITLL